MKRSISLLTSICISCAMSMSVLAQQKTGKKGTTTDHTVVVHPAVAASAQQAVQTLGDKIKQGDFMYGYDTMYPRYRKRQEALHGAEKLKSQFLSAKGELLKMGVTIKNFKSLQPTGFFRVWPKIKPAVKARIDAGEIQGPGKGDVYYHWMVIVPTQQVWAFLSQNGGKTRYLQRDEFQIAIAKETDKPGQEQWSFIASPIKEQQIRALFPTISQDLKLPKLLDKEIK